MSKLLNKPLKVFAIYAVLILACSIPIYYLIVDSIWINELDEHNHIVREQTQTGFNRLAQEGDDLEKSIAVFSKVQAGVFISEADHFSKDSVYTVERTMSHNGLVETDRFRGLGSSIQINGRPYLIRIETNVEEADETVLAIALITCAFIALLIVGFVFLNKRLSKQIWTPFTDTLERLKAFDLNTSSRIDFETTDIIEFRELNVVLEKLIDNNVLVYRQQKEFTQNASHELQTPLALLKTKLDLLIQDSSLTTDQRQIIESLSTSVSRVTRVNKNLLLLAGIENRHYETEQVAVTELVKILLVTFSDFAANRKQIISTHIQEKVVLHANESLVEVLISNLLSNTIRHGLEDSSISITLNTKSLIITNDGRSPLTEENLFKRFISATPDNPGTGLGLAIVKEISEKYKWRVSYNFDGKRHVFSVFFQF